MEKKNLIIGTLAFIAISLIVGVVLAKWISKPEQKVATQGEVSDNLKEKTDGGEGGITVTARPVTKLEVEEIVFEFALNTHSVDLSDFDVGENVVLVAGNSSQEPSEWREESTSTHHRSGKLVFKFPANPVPEVNLVIKNLGGVVERSLTWEL